MVKISFTSISRVLEMIKTALLYLKDLVIVKYSKDPLLIIEADGMKNANNTIILCLYDVKLNLISSTDIILCFSSV
jgi:hypothetical protein